jgi:hypothetical protein
VVGKNKFVLLFLITFFVQFILIIYFNRNSFFNAYNLGYWKDRFEHSQWQLPLSNRIIGDDGLFSYVGYTLTRGEDPSKNNPETQPVAKYLIGFSIILFNNPVYYSLIMGFSSLILFFLLCERLFKNKVNSLFATLILFLDPLFFSQFWKAWVDIAQLFFLLLSLLAITYLKKSEKRIVLFSILSGVSLGLFTQVKLPIIFPILLIIESFVFIKNKLIKEYFIYLISFLVGVFIPYIQYFLLGNSLLDFIRFQKYIASFYYKSQLVNHFGAIWQSLVLGNFINISGGGLTRVLEWWLLWPVSFFISLFTFLYLLVKKDKNSFLKGLGFFVFVSLLIFGLIPSYPRYLVILIPFFYIFFVFFIDKFINNKYKLFLYVIIVMYGIINSFIFLFPKPDSLINNFYHNFSHMYFQDIYEENILSNNTNLTINEFRQISMSAMKSAQVENIEIKELERNIPLDSNKAWVKVRINYKTLNLGSFSEEKTINLIKYGSEWKINWDWGIVLNNFLPGNVVITTLDVGKRGSIIKNGKILAKDTSSYLISVNPEEIDLKKENIMLKKISSLSGIVPVRLQNAYLENVLPGEYVPLVTLSETISDNEIKELLAFSGVKLTSYQSRLYNPEELSRQSIKNTFYNECCTRIYSSYNFHGVDGLEKQFDEKLSGFNGGKIEIMDKNRSLIRTIIKKPYKNGQDVSLSL